MQFERKSKKMWEEQLQIICLPFLHTGIELIKQMSPRSKKTQTYYFYH